MISILAIPLALSLLIVAHEGGHYFVARWCGMRVDRFSIGFGPALFKWTSKGGTVFQFAAIPFGGFVEIKGMNIAEEVDPDDREAYPNRPVWQRIATIFAGPFTNYLFAVVLAFGLYLSYGVAERRYAVESVEPGFDAVGKLEAGDRVVAVGGRLIDDAELSDATNALGAKPALFTVRRGDDVFNVELTPRYDDKTKRYRIGVVRAEQLVYHPLGVGEAATEAVAFPWRHTKAMLGAIYGKFAGKNDLELGGPVEMGAQVKRAVERGTPYVLELLMFLNVALGLFNLLPLPALDGGRLAFLGYELVTRRRANPRVEMTVMMVGVLALIVLMVFVTYGDILRRL